MVMAVDGGGLAARPASPSAGASAARPSLFYLAVASLIVPSILVSLGIGLAVPACSACEPAWYTSAFGAHLTWTLPFGLLIMFAVFNRFDRPTRRRRATSAPRSWQTFRHVVAADHRCRA